MPLLGELYIVANPEFESSFNPITTRGADYAHHITASPPRFENPAAALFLMLVKNASVVKERFGPNNLLFLLDSNCIF